MSTYRLISWGANSHGQLGQGILSEQCILPQNVDLSGCSLRLEGIRKIVGGAGHTLILDKDGQVYSCGLNNKGQTGNGNIDQRNVLTFQKIFALEHKIVVNICCGWDSSAALTKDGELYVWGSNRYGQLGLNHSSFPTISQPCKIFIGEKVKYVSMGLRHTAIMTDSCELYTCGANNKGQLGLINPITMKPYVLRDTFTKVPDLELQSNIENIACGQYYTIAITKKQRDIHDIYVFGDNKHGQLGVCPKIFSEMKFWIPIHIPLFDVQFDMPIQIYAGWNHINILSNGIVFSWGRNDYGQLGQSSSFKDGISIKKGLQHIEHIPRIAQLSVGSEHNVALTDDGAILCWGWNEHGNCGNGNTENVLKPEFLSISTNSVGVLVGAGTGHSFALIQDNCNIITSN